MKDVSEKVAVDDRHLNEISKRVEASEQKIAQYNNRNAVDDLEEESPEGDRQRKSYKINAKSTRLDVVKAS